jgi:putative DNA methylase
MKTVLSDINWSDVERQIKAEIKNREVHQPLVSLYRWWARRPHSLIGAILDAGCDPASEETLVVDPFSGGGTVAIEAIRRGLRVYAQDINPWAAWGLMVSLAPVCPDTLARAGDSFLQALRGAESHRYDGPNASTTIHTFRVRRAQCGNCASPVWCFPYALVSVASRSLNEEHGFFGCRGCGTVTRHRLDAVAPRCSECGVTYSDRDASYCPHCRAFSVSDAARRIAPHEVVLVQRWRQVADGTMVYLDLPTDIETSRTRRSARLAASLASDIPLGHETTKLRRAGFRTWASLYPTRQLEVLVRAAELLETMNFQPVIRDRLRLCLAGATEMPGYLCRWDRYHPKVFEALSNHRYSFDGLAVEPNPLAPAGRGSLTRRLRASVIAAKALAEVTSSDRSVVYLRTDTNRIANANQAVTIAQGSSEKVLLPNHCASIIVTDPPYFDSVQYGELASLFLAWSGPMGIADKAGIFRRRCEAVPNRFRRTGAIAYQRKLVAIFAECARVIHSRGRLVLTYHSTDLRAWWALGSALSVNGFHIAAIAAARTENGSDHSKRGKRSFVSDLLIECALGTAMSTPQRLTVPRSPEHRELLAIGEAMAEVGHGQYHELRTAFARRTARLSVRLIDAPDVPLRLRTRGEDANRRKESDATPKRPRRRRVKVFPAIYV